MAKNKKTLEEWFDKVKEYAMSEYDYQPSDAEALDANDFEWMFDEDYSPKEAMQEFEGKDDLDWNNANATYDF